MINVFTVDVEDWYQAHDLGFAVRDWPKLEGRVEYGIRILLDLLAASGCRGTFFVVEAVARRHPRLVREIAAAGHEIGSHGKFHEMVSRQTRNSFRRHLLDSKRRLEDLTGQKVQLYRAPSWSISAGSLWALEVLEEEGFVGDSSLQPFRTFLSGMRGVPVTPFYPVIAGRRLQLVEFPPTVLQVGCFRLPFAGGFYLRLMPLDFILWALARINRSRPGMVYVHPWELDPRQPRMRVGPLRRFVHYANLHTTKKKVEVLLRRFVFAPLGEVIACGNFPALSLGGSCGRGRGKRP